MSVPHSQDVEYPLSPIIQQPPLPYPDQEPPSFGVLDPITYVFVAGFLIGAWFSRWNNRK